MQISLRHLWAAGLSIGFLAACAPRGEVETAALPQREPPARAATTMALPADTAVRVGTLPNGMTYYIRVNNEPENRAELRLVVRAGSLQEDDDQRGLAHFLEHMAFNGTRNFEKHRLIEYLESIGMRFGADLNAYTTFDHTLYMLTVPTDTEGPLETGLQILDDWAQGITLDPGEVEAERGVVLAEWRSRLGVASRVTARTDSVMLGESRYLDRNPIGLPELIEHAPREALLRFYRDWYRPDLMAVIVVGAVDKDRVETMIRERFGDLARARRKVRERVDYTIPSHNQTLVAVVTDPELTGSKIELHQKFEPHPINTMERRRAGIVQGLFAAVLNRRLQVIAIGSHSPFLGAATGFGEYLGGKHVHTVIGVSVRDEAVIAGFRAALREVERIAQHGITAEELDREKRLFRSRFVHAMITLPKMTSGSHATAYVRHFVTGIDPDSTEESIALSRRLLDEITTAEVSALAHDWKSRRDLVLLAMIPEKDGVEVPTREELLAVLDEVADATLPAEPATVASTVDLGDLVPASLQPGAVVSEESLPEVEVTIWRLANGARLILKPTDFNPDQILLAGYGWGGSSVYGERSQIRDLVLAQALPGVSGIGSLNSIELQNALVGKLVSARIDISSYTQSVSGRSTVRDFESFLQLVHLLMTAPRVDDDAITSWRRRAKTAIEGRLASPEAHFADSLRSIMAQWDPRSRALSVAEIDSIDAESALEIYQDRFTAGGDFTFVLVGAFEPDSVRPLIEKYIGGLSEAPRPREWRDTGIRAPQGVVEKEFRFGREPRARTAIIFTGDFTHDDREVIVLNAMTDILSTRLRERLREALGGTYSVSVQASVNAIPERAYTIMITFDAAPERVEEMRRAVFEEIDELQATGPTAAEIANAREEFTRQIELALKNNSFWIQMLTGYDQTGRPLGELATFGEYSEELDAEVIHTMSRQYLNTARFVRLTQLPVE